MTLTATGVNNSISLNFPIKFSSTPYSIIMQQYTALLQSSSNGQCVHTVSNTGFHYSRYMSQTAGFYFNAIGK